MTTTHGPIHLMVAMDFSQGALRALDEAVRMAAYLGGELEVVHVMQPSASGAAVETFVDARLEREAKAQLEELCAQQVPRTLVARMHVFYGEPVFGLLAAIAHLRPYIVVVGSHGRGALARVFLGSVSGALVQRSPAPVLVVPDSRRAARLEAGDHDHDLARPRHALYCARCGHLPSDAEATNRCQACGLSPGSWEAAPPPAHDHR